ncbi:MAG: S-layer homology domain-containing protein [Bacillota bacterium]
MQRKTILALLLSMCIVLSLGTQAFAANFTDLGGHWAEGPINEWAAKGLAGGYADGTFKPNQQVSRAEFVALVNRAFAIGSSTEAAGFADVKENQWFYKEVAAAKAAGYIGGYNDGTFRPSQAISRQEAASILVRLLKLQTTTEGVASFNDAAQIQAWARGGVGAVFKSGLMHGFPDNTFRPLKSITRAEAVVSLDRALNAGKVSNSGVEGKVTLSGKAVSNAVVRVFAADSYKVMQEAKTDSNGYYKLSLPKGKYDLTATTGTEVAYQSGVTVVDNKVTSQGLTLEKAAVLKGSLKDKDDRTVKNAAMAFTTNPTFVTTTDKDGKYTIAVLPNRSYTVRAYNPEKKDQEASVVTTGFAVGAAGTHVINALKAPFEVSSSVGGGGGGGGGGVPASNPEELNTAGTYNKNYTIDKSGTFGPASGTSVVNGTLTVNPGATGTVTLQNIQATGIVITSGASNSIHLKNVTANSLTVDAGNQSNSVRIVTEGNTTITQTTVKSKVILKAESGTFGGVTVAAAAAGQAIELQGTFNGNFTVAPGANGVVLTVAEGATVSQLVLSGNVTLNGNLSGVTNITVGDGVVVGGDAGAELTADLNAANAAKAALSITYAGGDSAAFVTQNVTLPSKVSGLDVSWISSDSQVISNTGTVQRKSTTKTITLTATITKGKVSVTKAFTLTVKAYIIPRDHTLPALLDAIQEAFNGLTDAEWNELVDQRDELISDLTEDQILNALRAAGFESLINSDITIDEARTTLGIVRSLAYLGRDNVSSSLGEISAKITELKALYNEEIARLSAEGVTQEAVYNYVIALYDGILAGDYTVRKDGNYEADLYNAALAELRKSEHTDLCDATHRAYDRVVAFYTADPTYGDVIEALAPSFEDLTGENIVLAKVALKLIKPDADPLFDTFDFMLELSKTFLP